MLTLSTAFSPVWLALYAHTSHDINMFSSGAYWIIQPFALAVALAVVRFCPPTGAPPLVFQVPLALYGFVVAATWIDFVADQLVSILSYLGIIMNIPAAVLGLTVLAWGNSIGDLVADLSVARAGSPNMAVTACFAGPLFNMLVGLGVSFFVQCAATGGPVRVDYSTGVKNTTLVSLTVSFVGLAGILCATALAGGVGGFRLRKWWIWPLMGYYSSYMLAEVIIAFVQGN